MKQELSLSPTFGGDEGVDLALLKRDPLRALANAHVQFLPPQVTACARQGFGAPAVIETRIARDDAALELCVQALEATRDGRVMLLTGLAGSGKSTLSMLAAAVYSHSYDLPVVVVDVDGFSDGDGLTRVGCLTDCVRQLKAAFPASPILVAGTSTNYYAVWNCFQETFGVIGVGLRADVNVVRKLMARHHGRIPSVTSLHDYEAEQNDYLADLVGAGGVVAPSFTLANNTFNGNGHAGLLTLVRVSEDYAYFADVRGLSGESSGVTYPVQLYTGWRCRWPEHHARRVHTPIYLGSPWGSARYQLRV